MQANKAFGGGDGGIGLIKLVVGVGNLKLRLLGEASEWVTRLQELEILDGVLIVTLSQGGMRLAGQPLVGSCSSGSQEQPLIRETRVNSSTKFSIRIVALR